jgi:hypothetical protein
MTGVSALRPDGEAPRPEEADAQPVAHFAHLRQVLMHLLAGVMHAFERCAGEFELAAGLQRDIAEAIGVRQRDDVLALINTRPAEAVAQAFEQRLD